MRIRQSEHFRFEYAVRTPFTRPPAEPLDGDRRYDNVLNERYVRTFEEALEAAWAYFERHDWPLPKPPVEIRFEDIPAEGLTKPAGDGLGIVFPARHEDCAGPCNRSRAQCAAAHELFHVIQGYMLGEELDLRFIKERAWVWFSDACATYLAREIFKDNTRPFLYLPRWLDEPDRPLTDGEPDRRYGSFIFCKYLNDRFPRADVVKRIWDLAPGCESALEAIEQCLGTCTNTPFASADGRDLFCNEFLAWNFFFDLWKGPRGGRRPHGYADGRMLRRRFQHAFAGNILLPDGDGILERKFPRDLEPRRDGRHHLLEPLAGRYHLLRAPAGTRRCRVTLTLVTETPVSSCPGKGVIYLTRGQHPCGVQEKVRWVKACDGNGTFQRETDVSLDGLEGKQGQVLLIVANTAWREPVGITKYTIGAKFE